MVDIGTLFTVIFFFGIVLVITGTFLILTMLYSVDRFIGLIIRQEKAIKGIANSLPLISPMDRKSFPAIPFEEAAEPLRAFDYLVLLLLVAPGILISWFILNSRVSFLLPHEPRISAFQTLDSRLLLGFFQFMLSILFIWGYFASCVRCLSKLVLWIVFGSYLKEADSAGMKGRERRVTWFGFWIFVLGTGMGVFAYIGDKYVR